MDILTIGEVLIDLTQTGKHTALVSAVAALAYSDEMFILLCTFIYRKISSSRR